jgi:hypothetical protein
MAEVPPPYILYRFSLLSPPGQVLTPKLYRPSPHGGSQHCLPYNSNSLLDPEAEWPPYKI